MSSSKTKPKPKISFFDISPVTVVAIISLIVVFGVIMLIILSREQRLANLEQNAPTPADSIEQSQSVSYDKDKILIDDTAEPLEIVELPSLEAK